MSIIAGALIGAGVSALGGLASSALTNSANANLDAENRRWQTDMYHYNNAYNTPYLQRRRLELAGINPMLAFQNSGTGVAASAPTPNQHTPADYSALGTGISQAASYYLQAKQMDSQTALLDSQAEGQRIKNLNQYAVDVANLSKALAEAKKIGADTSWIEWSLERSQAMFDAEYKKNYHEIMSLDARRDADEANARYQDILNSFAPNQQAIITSNLQKQGDEILSNIYKNDRQAALASAQEALTDAQRQGVSIDNNTKRKMSEYIVDEQYYKSQTERYRGSKERKEFYGGRIGKEMPTLPFGDRYKAIPSRKRSGGVR